VLNCGARDRTAAMRDKPVQFSRPSAGMLLARIFEQPGLVAAVQALPPAVLSKLIAHVDLEDAGEIVALATTEQLERVFENPQVPRLPLRRRAEVAEDVQHQHRDALIAA
jgi:hypothetical protein